MALWLDGEDQDEKRRNRESFPIRLLSLVYDITQGGSVTAAAKPIDGDDIVTTETTHYTAGSGLNVALVRSIKLANVAGATKHASVHVVESGGSRTVANMVFDGDLLDGETVTLGPFFMDPSDTIRSISADAAANQVVLRADVLELSGGHPAGVKAIVDDGSALTASHASYYACPASNVQHANVYGINVCNTDAANQAVEVAIVPSGQTALARYFIFSYTLLPGETISLGSVDDPFVLEPGDFVSAKAGAAVSIRVSPVEFATS